MKDARLKSGIAGFDSVIGGGFPEGSVVLFSGHPGTGKTLAAMCFLMEGASKGEKCVYISFNETREALLRAASSIKALSGASRYMDKTLDIQKLSISSPMDVEKVMTSLFDKYPKIDRLVIDSLNKLLYTSRASAYREHLSTMADQLRDRVRCSVLICETEGEALDSGNGESFEADGVARFMFLPVEEVPPRVIEIQKLRFTDFRPLVKHEFEITSSGIRLTGGKAV